MKALVYTGPSQMEIRDTPDAIAGQGEALIRVEAVGICGSDMHGYLGHDDRRPAPLILGHEAAGTVLSGELAGKRVTVNPLVTCQNCAACKSGRTNLCADRQIISMPPREGAFAQLLTMPERNLFVLPDDISFQKAALAEPLAVCWHAVKMAHDLMWQDVVDAKCIVIGGGAIGLGAALALTAFGAKDVVVVESNAARAEYLRAMFDYPVCAPDDLANNTAGNVDLVVDAVGFRATRELACCTVGPGGTICHIGLGDAKDGIDVRRLTLQEITFFGTYAYTAQDFNEATSALIAGQLGELEWIVERPLDEGAQAFAEILSGKTLAPKTILIP